MDRRGTPDAPPDEGLLRARRGSEPITSTELFFDLVYIFSITQLSRHLLGNVSWLGGIQTAALLALVWLVWIYTAWITNWLHPDRSPVRAMLLASMLGSLLLSAAIPSAFAGTGMVFAVTYAVLQIGRTSFALWAIRHRPVLVTGFQCTLCWLSLSSILVIAGAFTGGHVRLGIWIAAVAIDMVGLGLNFPVPGLRRTPPEEWNVEGGHLAERCKSFILIALGESILTTGAGLADHFTVPEIGPLVLAFTGSVALWAVYFAYTAEAGTRTLANARERTGRLSRASFNYIHPVMVAGIILTGAGDDRLLRSPGAPADPATVAFVLGGAATFLAGHAAYQAILWPVTPRVRIVAVLVLLLLIPVAGRLSTAALAGVVLAVTVAVVVADRMRRPPAPQRPRRPRRARR